MFHHALRPAGSWLAVVCVVAALFAGSANAQQAAYDEIKTDWDNFAHTVMIARPERAVVSARRLASDDVDAKMLLLVIEEVEANTPGRYAQVMRRGQNIDEELGKLTLQLADKISEARFGVAGDPDRIRADIEKLGGTLRERFNATKRLRQVGQFTAPFFLEYLEKNDPESIRLRPFLVQAMTQVGRPLSYPLGVALPNLDGEQQVLVTTVIQDIGYPSALPYVIQSLEQQGVGNEMARVGQAAQESLARILGAPIQEEAAESFLRLANRYYNSGITGREIPGAENSRGFGLFWRYDDQLGLVSTRIPLEIYPDRRAMQAARSALALKPELSEALTVYIAANLRRENRLGDAKDPSYQELPAAYYATLAGPERVHEVLGRALDAEDGSLAVDAIQALAATAGPASLVRLDEARQPVLQALSFPDRRVRRSAAMALGAADPLDAFPGSAQVVPTLGKAVRESDEKFAVVLSATREESESLADLLEGYGYTVVPGTSVADTAPALTVAPSIDLLVLSGDSDITRPLLGATRIVPQVAAAPVLVLTTTAEQLRLKNEYGEQGQVVAAQRFTASEADTSTFESAVRETTNAYAGDDIPSAEAEAAALDALELLRDIARKGGDIYEVSDIEPLLIEALGDDRPAVVQSVGHTLALLNSEAAQRALAAASNEASGPTQVSLLDSLAASARAFGSQLTDEEGRAIRDLVKVSDTAVALAAARAHGALSLPTQQSVGAILGED